MRTSGRLMASVLAGLLAAPAWCATNPVVATAGPSQTASVRGMALLAETSIYSGDIVVVGPRGEAVLSFGGGATARLGEDTTLRITQMRDHVALDLERGRVSFRSSEQFLLEGRSAGASVRSASGTEAEGSLSFRSSGLLVVTAEKGNLLVSISRDTRTILLREGKHMELRLDAQDEKSPADRQTKGGSSFLGLTHKQWLTVGAIVGGAALGVGLVISGGQTGLTDQQKQKLVTPFVFPPR